MEYFPSLQSLTLMGQAITELENLEHLPNLTELCVSECKLSVSRILQFLVRIARHARVEQSKMRRDWGDEVRTATLFVCLLHILPSLSFFLVGHLQIKKKRKIANQQTNKNLNFFGKLIFFLIFAISAIQTFQHLKLWYFFPNLNAVNVRRLTVVRILSKEP